MARRYPRGSPGVFCDKPGKNSPVTPRTCGRRLWSRVSARAYTVRRTPPTLGPFPKLSHARETPGSPEKLVSVGNGSEILAGIGGSSLPAHSRVTGTVGMSRGCRNRIGVCRRREGIRPAPSSPHPGFDPPPSSRSERSSHPPPEDESYRGRACPSLPCLSPLRATPPGREREGELTGAACDDVPAPLTRPGILPVSWAHPRARRVREAARRQDAREPAGWVAGGLGRGAGWGGQASQASTSARASRACAVSRSSRVSRMA